MKKWLEEQGLNLDIFFLWLKCHYISWIQIYSYRNIEKSFPFFYNKKAYFH